VGEKFVQDFGVKPLGIPPPGKPKKVTRG